MKPDAVLIRTELERLLSSPKIRSRKLIKKFLHYVVEETLAGRGATLNQYNIAVYGLGKSVDFSPLYNPVVRIEAGRLRKLLQEYYLSNPDSQVMILIPKGAYQAEFHSLDLPGAPFAASSGYLCTAGNAEGPRLLLHMQSLPLAMVSSHAFLYKIHGELLLILSRFRDIRLVSSVLPETGHLLTRQSLQRIHEEYLADYVLQGDMCDTADGIELSFILAHTSTDEILWKTIVQLPPESQPAEIKRICYEVSANTVSLHSGLMLRHWGQYWQSQPSGVPARYIALVYYLGFIRNITPETFAVALSICQQRLQQCPDDSTALTILSRLCSYDYMLHYQQVPDLEQTWTNASRMAVKLAPGSADAHSAFAYNNYYRGDTIMCRAELEIARQANPYDISCEFLYAAGMLFLGDKTVFLDSMTHLLKIRCDLPDWYWFPLFLYYFNEKNYREALNCAERIQYFGYWGELARCVSYFHLGQYSRALAELPQLLKKQPDILQADALHRPLFIEHPVMRPLRMTLEDMLNGNRPE